MHKATGRLGVQIPALLYICFVTLNEFNIFLPQLPYLGYDDNNSTIILRLGARIELMPVEAGLQKLSADVVCLLFLLSIPSSVLPAEAPGKLLERKAWRHDGRDNTASPCWATVTSRCPQGAVPAFSVTVSPMALP